MSISGFKRENSIGNNTKLDEALRVLDSALSEIRTLSHLLHPPNLELLGLGPSLAWLAEGFQKRTGIETQLEAPRGATIFLLYCRDNDFPRCPGSVPGVGVESNQKF